MSVSDRLRVHAGSVLTTTDRVLIEAADEIDRLRAKLAECKRAASDAAHLLEQARIWNGGGWHWNHLRATVALHAWETLTTALAAKEGSDE